MKSKPVIFKVFGAMVFITMLICSCTEVLPKPKAMLRLEYDEPNYMAYAPDNCPYWFELNNNAITSKVNECNLTLRYPEMKGSIYVSYRTVNGDLDKLLSDVQKLTYEHVVKADKIVEQPYINQDDKKYGMFYEVTGNAASQSQFYLTDSVSHFITGSIYFNSKPNYDSILPAAVYLKDDVRKIMESLKWR